MHPRTHRRLHTSTHDRWANKERRWSEAIRLQTQWQATGERVALDTPHTVTHVFGVTSCDQMLHVRFAGKVASCSVRVEFVSSSQGAGPDRTLASPPMRRSNRVDVHTRSQVKVGSVPSSGLRSDATRHLQLVLRRLCTRCQRHCGPRMLMTSIKQYRHQLLPADLLLVSSSGFALPVPPPTRPLIRIAGTVKPWVPVSTCCAIAHHWYSTARRARWQRTCQACHPPRLHHGWQALRVIPDRETEWPQLSARSTSVDC